jgi:hypothetical protein
MDEEEFLTKYPMRPWTQDDHQEHQRVLVWSSLFWGNAEHLRNQLLAPSPEIPTGLGLLELESLERFAALCLKLARKAPTRGPLSRQLWKAKTINVDGRELTMLEVRLIIVQRAIAAKRGN